MFNVRKLKILLPKYAKSIYGCTRIGNRDVVGYGVNGCYNYKDDAHFPFPAIRFKENDTAICNLRSRETGDWKCLSCEEKKALYRASFCSTFSEFQCNTGTWKFVVGMVLITTSFSFWAMMFNKRFVNEPLPTTMCEEYQQHQLRRMLEIMVNPIDGLSSQWDYANDTWK